MPVPLHWVLKIQQNNIAKYNIRNGNHIVTMVTM